MDNDVLNDWFCREVLPLERALLNYIRRNWRTESDVVDLLHDIYALTLHGAAKGLPAYTPAYLFAVARNHLALKARRARIISLELVADLESCEPAQDVLETDRHLAARDDLRQVQAALDALPPRCGEAIRLRKVEGLTTRETAERMGVGVDAIEQHLTKGMRMIAEFMSCSAILPASGRSGAALRARRRR